MDNPTIILQTLDRHLDHAVSLVLYRRAAIQLGFENAPEETGRSMDVDAIIPMSDRDALVHDERFWDALDAANAELKDRDFYITHLFQEDQVFLRRSWKSQLVPVERPALRWLRLARPAGIDLVLTKMMRGNDEHDMRDVAFLLRHDHITPEQLEAAFSEVMMPDDQELHDAFVRARPRVLELAHRQQIK